MLPNCSSVSDELEERGISSSLYSFHTVKPLKRNTLKKFSQGEHLITVEEHGRLGGFGSAVAEWLASQNQPRARLLTLGTPISSCSIPASEEARKKCGLTKRVCSNKSRTSSVRSERFNHHGLYRFHFLIHKSTTRDYVARVTEYPKAKAAEKAKTWGYDYWDGDRRWGYENDPRWSLAEDCQSHGGTLWHQARGQNPGRRLRKGSMMTSPSFRALKFSVWIFPNMPKPIQKRKSASQLQLETQAIFHGVTILSISWFRSILFTTFRITTSIQPFGRFRGSERKEVFVESYRNEDESQPAHWH